MHNEGEITVNNLPYGEYSLIEIKAPDGYELNPEPIKFTISDSTEIHLTFENKLVTSSPIGPGGIEDNEYMDKGTVIGIKQQTLPNTGGNQIIYTLSLIFTTLGIIFLWYKKSHK